MRRDMDKVLCERPRSRPRFKRRSLYRGPLEDAPRFESSSRERGGDKELSEHLGPLRRWLVRQVGRHWDDVYADLRANISPKSAVQMHIWDHARHFVAERVVFVDGCRGLGTAFANRCRLDGCLCTCARRRGFFASRPTSRTRGSETARRRGPRRVRKGGRRHARGRRFVVDGHGRSRRD